MSEWEQMPAAGSTSGGNQRSGGCYSNTVMPMILEWYVQDSHMGRMLVCPHTFGHVV